MGLFTLAADREGKKRQPAETFEPERTTGGSGADTEEGDTENVAEEGMGLEGCWRGEADVLRGRTSEDDGGR